MTSGNWKIVPVLSLLALATIAAPNAHAGCGLYHPITTTDASLQPLISLSQLEQESVTDDESAGAADPSIVGTWKEHWYSEGSKGIPDGTEVDANYAQLHSDGTEMQVSGMRTPPSGEICIGEWIKTGTRTYQINHFGVSFDATGQNLIGPAHIQQSVTLNAKGDATSGKFSIDQFDEDGNLLAHLQGKFVGTRVTMETGFQKVE